jgi:hypothetical protein
MTSLKNLSLKLLETYKRISNDRFQYSFTMKEYGKILTKDPEPVGMCILVKL